MLKGPFQPWKKNAFGVTKQCMLTMHLGLDASSEKKRLVDGYHRITES